MQDTQLLHEGFALMGLGMGFVFVFLTVLVITTTLMSKALGRFFPEPAPGAANPRPGRVAPARDDELMAVLSAAVHRYRREHRR
ncbi:OadG family protein [Halomonas beimenensis]|uniref:Probable oxaloacetate decarboxylase gamma chain n=1 Tax=Halomonas beimenensis TaxID=475662 RepID=A0A291PB61_9GAMM|nr:OadG family transporter subunit [Halomonas beimenensis]ATJ84134.1 oxaloacetate decarboxylase gamma chain [Halomonas beimenensis]